jgi:adenosine deaminase
MALDHFAPARIAHGVRSVEDSALLDELGERGIHLELALTSNVQTGCVRGLTNHPFADLLRSGLSVSLNTDNRTISGTTLSAEYAAAGLSRAELARSVELAARATFLPASEREALVGRVRAWCA